MQRKSLAKSPKPATPSNRKSLAKTPKAGTPSLDASMRRKSVAQEVVNSPSKKRKSTLLEDTPGKRKSLKKEVEVDSEGEDDDDSGEEVGSEEELGSDDEDLGSDEEGEDDSGDEGSDSGDDAGEAKSQQNKTEQVKTQKKKKEKKERIDHPSKTIFVGNLPKEMDKGELKKIFTKYGTVSSLRLRSAPVADPRTPKKVAVIKKEFHPERSNINAYIVFATDDMAKNALKANGTEIDGHHIRVDMVKREAPDNKKAVFIGNVPFGADEEQLRKVFVSCGKISSVRIVRDKSKGMGKGFAYVNFETADSVELALLKDGEELDKRPLRVQRSQEKPTRNRTKKQRQAKPEGEFKGQKPSQAGKGGKKNRKPKPRTLTKNGDAAQTTGSPKAFQGQKTADKGKVQKKKKAAKMSPKKQEAIETLAKTMPGSAKKDKRKSAA